MISYENYAKFRNSQNLKDSDVAKAAGIPQSTFSDWKKGKSSPKTEKLEKIRKALNLSVSEFFGSGEDVTEEQKLIYRATDFLIEKGKKEEIIEQLSDEDFNILADFQNLDEEHQKIIVEMIAFYKSKKQD